MAEAPDINVDELRRRARRRLLGAIVLALAAAVIVPMLLESDPKPLGEDVSVKIPPEDNAKFVNRLSDKGAKTSGKKAAAKEQPAKEPAPAEPAPASPTAPAPAAPAPAAPAPTAPAPAAPRKVRPLHPPPASCPRQRNRSAAGQKVLGAQGNLRQPLQRQRQGTVAAPRIASACPSVAPPPLADPNRDERDANRDGFSVQRPLPTTGANALATKTAAYPAYTGL
jgi:DedD protein